MLSALSRDGSEPKLFLKNDNSDMVIPESGRLLRAVGDEHRKTIGLCFSHGARRKNVKSCNCDSSASVGGLRARAQGEPRLSQRPYNSLRSGIAA